MIITKGIREWLLVMAELRYHIQSNAIHSMHGKQLNKAGGTSMTHTGMHTCVRNERHLPTYATDATFCVCFYCLKKS